MRRIKKSGKFSILAVLLVLSLLMTSSLVFADDEVTIFTDKSSLCDTGETGKEVSTLFELEKVVEGDESQRSEDFTVDIFSYIDGVKGDSPLRTLAFDSDGEIKSIPEDAAELPAGTYYIEERNPGDGWTVNYEPQIVELTAGVVQIWAGYRNTGEPGEGDMSDDPPSATYDVFYSENPITGNKDDWDNDYAKLNSTPITVTAVNGGETGQIYCPLEGETLEPGFYAFRILNHASRPEAEHNYINCGTIEVEEDEVLATASAIITNTFEKEFDNKVIIKKFIDEDGGSTDLTKFPMQLLVFNDETQDWDPYEPYDSFDVNVFEDDDDAYEITDLPAGTYKLQEIVSDITDSDFNSVQYTLNGQAIDADGVEFDIDEDSSESQTIEISVTNKFDFTNKVIIKKFIDANGGSTSLTSFPMHLLVYIEGWEPYGEPFDVEKYASDEDNAYIIENLPAGSYKLEEIIFGDEDIDGVADLDPNFNSVQYTLNGQYVDAGGVEFDVDEESSEPQTVEISVTNRFDLTNKVIIKKFIDATGGSTSLTKFPVQLWYDNDGEWSLLGDLNPNPFDVEVYDEDNAYIIENLPAGHYKLMELVDEVKADDSDFLSVKYAAEGPPESVLVVGDDNDAYVEFYIYDTLVPTYMTFSQVVVQGPGLDIIEISITNKFDKEVPPPDYPDLVIKKTIGTGSTSQDYFTVELQKQEYERQAGDNWDTKETYSVPKNGSKTIAIKDLVDNYGSGNYRVVELADSNNIDDWSDFKSVYFAVGQGSRVDYTNKNASTPFASESFALHEELEKDVTVTITNNFESGGGPSGDPDLIIKKVIGSGSTDQNNFTVLLQVREDGAWEDVDTYTIPKNGSKRSGRRRQE